MQPRRLGLQVVNNFCLIGCYAHALESVGLITSARPIYVAKGYPILTRPFAPGIVHPAQSGIVR